MARRLITVLALLAMAGVAHAQLADPTRPPAALGLAAGDPAGAAVFESGGLQSVILRKGGKPAALINGSVVELGGKVGEARLIKVSEDSVVLRGPQGDETLRLIPAAEKKVSRVGATQKPAQQAAQNRKTDK
ncbi:MAG: hypothetical protein Q7U85_03160 [Rhodocyclaceae bacterium]|nr:hypothetical protein [Rhodocyclaceae bacterium]